MVDELTMAGDHPLAPGLELGVGVILFTLEVSDQCVLVFAVAIGSGYALPTFDRFAVFGLSPFFDSGANVCVGLREREMSARTILLFIGLMLLATSAQALTLARVHEPDRIIKQVRMGCGLGMVRINGFCVATVRQNCILWWPRCACPHWYGGACGWEKYSWRRYH